MLRYRVSMQSVQLLCVLSTLNKINNYPTALKLSKTKQQINTIYWITFFSAADGSYPSLSLQASMQVGVAHPWGTVGSAVPRTNAYKDKLVPSRNEKFSKIKLINELPRTLSKSVFIENKNKVNIILLHTTKRNLYASKQLGTKDCSRLQKVQHW